MKLLPYCFLFFFLAGCMSATDRVEKVYEKRDDILMTFKNLSVFRDRDNEFVFLHTYLRENKNKYYFDKALGKLSFSGEQISFKSDSILKIYRDQFDRVTEYKQALVDKVGFLLDKMDSLSVREISSEFISHGLDLKIYMKSGAVIAFVSNYNGISNPQWLEYVNSMKKLDQNWFYKLEE